MERIELYRFGHNSAFNSRFAWAHVLIARSPMVHDYSPACGAVHHYPGGAFDVAVEGGSQYPDVFGCGAYPFLIVSKEVVSDWESNEITGFQRYPVGVISVQSQQLHIADASRR